MPAMSSGEGGEKAECGGAHGRVVSGGGGGERVDEERESVGGERGDDGLQLDDGLAMGISVGKLRHAREHAVAEVT